MARDLPPRTERRRLTHVDRSGRPRMVDVSDKPVRYIIVVVPPAK